MPATVDRVTSVADLRRAILRQGTQSAAWIAKMLHPVPDVPVVADRAAYLIAKARGQVVLDCGCTGPISLSLREVAARYYGIDRVPTRDAILVDLDTDPEAVPIYPDVTLLVLSELLEHLLNPGRALQAIGRAYPNRSAVITVPHAGAYSVRDGCEMVNGEHVAYYSYTTLQTLLTRVGWRLEDMRWYHGQPHKAEGLIALARTPA